MTAVPPASPQQPPTSKDVSDSADRVPTSTYRVQLRREFTFAKARELVDYFADLGAGAWYMSPVLEARPGSPHGYDVINPSRLNPELGTEDEFVDLARRIAGRGMGLVMDVVPNHMCIDPGKNRFFDDVLE